MSNSTGSTPRIGVVVVAYNAESTLTATLSRIPKDFLDKIDEVIICDDASHDNTYEAGHVWAKRDGTPRTLIVRHTRNLGYGGNQKAAYTIAIEHGLDIAVLLHGDGQYAPEVMPQLVQPLLDGSCDAVFGSRMMIPGAAKRGGMPLYKRIGNRILTTIENKALRADLSEFHSGYRAYSTKALGEIPFQHNTDDFDFDTQIIIQLLDAGKVIKEIPIPTYYGDEICYVNGIGYAKNVVKDVLEYRLSKFGFGTSNWVHASDDYELKDDSDSSHLALLETLGTVEPTRVLDYGCAAGHLAKRARDMGHTVVGVDVKEFPGVRARTDEFYCADLNEGIPVEAGTDFGAVLAGDIIEHLQDPLAALSDIRNVMRSDGILLLSVPNFGHWYPRARVALGMFGYDRRGILDNTHLRFFTRAGIISLAREAGFDVVRLRGTGLPIGAVGYADASTSSAVRNIERRLVNMRPQLFAYQHVLQLAPRSLTEVHLDVASGETKTVDVRAGSTPSGGQRLRPRLPG